MGKNESCSIIIVGVGGQGTLLTSKIIAAAAMSRGLFVRTSETIGMAQRGGCVSSHIRIAAEKLSPVIAQNSADLLLGFELAESVRIAQKLAPGANAVINSEKIVPTNVALGKSVYTADEYIAYMKRKINAPLFINGTPLAVEAGTARALNVVMLGAATGAEMLPFSAEEMRAAVQTAVKPKTLETNLKAFELGFEFAKNSRQ